MWAVDHDLTALHRQPRPTKSSVTGVRVPRAPGLSAVQGLSWLLQPLGKGQLFWARYGTSPPSKFGVRLFCMRSLWPLPWPSLSGALALPPRPPALLDMLSAQACFWWRNPKFESMGSYKWVFLRYLLNIEECFEEYTYIICYKTINKACLSNLSVDLCLFVILCIFY